MAYKSFWLHIQRTPFNLAFANMNVDRGGYFLSLVVHKFNPTLVKSKDPNSAKDLCLNTTTYISSALPPSLGDGLKRCELEKSECIYNLYSDTFQKVQLIGVTNLIFQ